jgi:hypothetical protein
MTRFDFRDFLPQTVFKGEWDTKFDFLVFFNFLTSNGQKMIKFEFKRTNQELTAH